MKTLLYIYILALLYDGVYDSAFILRRYYIYHIKVHWTYIISY
jgi:hypothetical protein